MPFIILDRDGVINFESEAYIKSPEEWLPIPGSLEAIAKLNEHDYEVLVVTNQSGIGRGLYDHDILNAIHNKLSHELKKLGGHIHEIFYCPHHPEDGCICRKPKTGMLTKIKEKYAVNFEETFFIGDSAFDMEAAQTTGCLPLLVLTGNGEKTRRNYPQYQKIPFFRDLAHAVEFVIHRK